MDIPSIVTKLSNLSVTTSYRASYYAFSLFPVFAGPGSYLIDAPFGRFSWANSRFSFNANVGWFLMEIVSPIAFFLCLVGKPLSLTPIAATDFDMTAAVNRLQALSSPTKLLVGLYAIHYLNRSTIYPLRSPSKRAPMHFMVFLASVVFNVLNGSLLGTWMGGRTLPTTIGNQGAVPQEAFQSPFFWIGVGLWALGFAGNIYHDNILYDLRRPGKDGKQPPRYSIPHGGLYSRPFGGVSLPSYFCEWVEWAGFAIACSCMAPPPALPIFDSSTTAINEKVNLLVAAAKALFFQLVKWMTPFVPVAQKLLDDPSGHPLLQSATYLTPPWLFLINEVAAMVPRGFKSHQWYKQKFGNEFPKDRKAFLPGLL